MKIFAALIALTVVMAPTPAASQAARSYTCTITGSANTVRFHFRRGEFRMFQSYNGRWDENYCESEAACNFAGSRFAIDSYGFAFDYDRTTGAYNYSNPEWDLDGICRAE